MAYTFDATSGATLAKIKEQVLDGSFREARHGEMIEQYANDAVGDICRKLGIQRASVVCAVVDGVVTQPAAPFFRIESVWAASSSATVDEEGDNVAAEQGQIQVWPLTVSAADLSPTGSQWPRWYTARRSSPNGRYTSLRVQLTPAVGTRVILTGLRRPAVMDSTDDVTGLDAELDTAVLAYCRARCFEVEDDPQMAQYWDGRYDTLLRDISRPVVADGPVVTPGTWGYGSPTPGR